MRLSTPSSRRNTRLWASALNVVVITLIAAIPGTMRLSVVWSLANRAPNRPSTISGNRKLKNAAVGLRQNMRRSRRYWRQPIASVSDIAHHPGRLLAGARPGRGRRLVARGGRAGRVARQLQVDVLERWSPDPELLETLAAG